MRRIAANLSLRIASDDSERLNWMRLGVAADHGGFELKEKLVSDLEGMGHQVVDFGAHELDPADDYPDLIAPLALALSRGEVERGVAVCGSGVGACVAANKLPGVRACLIMDMFSAHQGVEDDDMNLICLGGRVVGYELAKDLVHEFLSARFKSYERFRRRLRKLKELESGRLSVMKENRLQKLESFGQSIWLDYIHRSLIDSGGLKRLIDQDALRGVTSNPSIFDEAIEGSDSYDDVIRGLAYEGKRVEEIYRAITTGDVGRAADILRPTFDGLHGADGFVSIEVNPHLAHDVEATVAEARSLWEFLARPNVFIKVPATLEGLKAIRQLLSEGINVNVTLLFGLSRYRMVAEAFIAGLEDRAAKGLSVEGIASVASFFLSRIDVLVDPMLEKMNADAALKLRGQIAISCAKIAYQMYRKIFREDRFRRLADLGAKSQRVLWAGTGTKNPEYSDVKYVEALIGPDTVNTLPMATLEAYRDHGNPASRLEENVEGAYHNLDRLAQLGIDLDEVARQLEDEGVRKFNKPYDSSMSNLAKKRDSFCLDKAC
jgi:transaldolase